MLKFFSAKTRMVNTARGVAECLESALGPANVADCDLIVYHVALGHDFKELLAETRRLAPRAISASARHIASSFFAVWIALTAS